MKAVLTIIFLAISMSSNAMADFHLANNKKPVVCYGEDNHSWDLNATRTLLKFTVEGESLGPKRILQTRSDRISWTSYRTVEGTLTLSNNGDTFRFRGESETWEINCK
jgi:hypothetical protein